jgi:phenol 2-monooxygenase (NADPH)
MNVSMMDSFNLSWKLIHSIHGLTPPAAKGSPDRILETFERERVAVARQLIDFDSKFSSMFSGQIGSDDPSLKDLTHEEFLKVFSDGSGFTSGCGLGYEPNAIVKPYKGPNANLVTKNEPLKGTLAIGRRLLDVVVRRYADANLRHLHDGLWLPLAVLWKVSTDVTFQICLQQAVIESSFSQALIFLTPPACQYPPCSLALISYRSSPWE